MTNEIPKNLYFVTFLMVEHFLEGRDALVADQSDVMRCLGSGVTVDFKKYSSKFNCVISFNN